MGGVKAERPAASRKHGDQFLAPLKIYSEFTPFAVHLEKIGNHLH